MVECFICCEIITKSKIICENCNNIICKKCLLSYKKFECCNCNYLFSEKNIKSNFTDKVIDQYIYYYVYKHYFFNDKIKSIIDEHLTKLENQKYLKFGYIKNNINNNENIIKRCFNDNCKGVFYNENCSLCNIKICLKCEELFHEPKDCDQNILQNLEEIKINCKKCPYCYTYINKTLGCNSMKCTNCGVSFNWRNLKIDNIKVNNLHYNTILNKQLNEEFLSHFDGNKFVPEKKKVFAFSFLKSKVFVPISFKDTFLKFLKTLKLKNKTLKLYKVKYYIEIENILKNNIEEHINYLFDKVNFKNCKKIYIEDKKHKFILNLFNELEKQFKNKECFNINFIKNYITEFNENNIIFNEYNFFFKNNNIILKNFDENNKKSFNKKFVIYDKKNYTNNGKINLLDEEQFNHGKNVFEKLIDYNTCLNSSYPGSGKSFISLYICKKLKIKNLIIILPKILYEKWHEIITYYNYKNKFNFLLLTYTELYTKKFENNNLFTKKFITERKINIEFSDYFKKFINDETMLIIDEIHNSKKNSSLSTIFIEELSKEIKLNNGYVLGLSATPLESVNEIQIIFKKLSLIKTYKPIPYNKDKYSLIYKKPIISIFDKLNNVEKNKNKNLELDLSDLELNSNSDLNSDSDSDLDIEINNYNNENNLENLPIEKIIELQKLISKLHYDKIYASKFLKIFKVNSKPKEQIDSKKTINIIKNLIKKYNMTPDEIYEKIIDIEGNDNNKFFIDIKNDKNNISEDYNDIKSIFNKNITDDKFLQECININDHWFEFKVNSYLLHNNETSIYLDLSKITYIEEIGFKLYNIFFTNSKHDKIELIKKISFLYLYNFKIFQIYYIFKNVNNLYNTLTKLLLNRINFCINIDFNTKIKNFKNLNYLTFSLNDEENLRISYAFTTIDVNTKENIDHNSLYYISIISKGLEQSETVYINYLFEFIKQIYPLNKFKITIALSFTNSINDLQAKLKEINYKFSIINGLVKDKNKIIKKFQNNEEDLLIVNIKSLNCGVDLDDKKGDKPRLILIVPNFSLTNLIQFMFRFKRKDSLSEPYIYIINNHQTILNNLIEKNKNLSELRIHLPFIKNVETIKYEEVIKTLTS